MNWFSGLLCLNKALEDVAEVTGVSAGSGRRRY